MTILDERPKWLEAAAKEIADLEEHQTWVEVPIEDAVSNARFSNQDPYHRTSCMVELVTSL